MHNSLVWKKQVQSNGLRVLTYSKPSGFTAQLAVAVEYGSNDDSDEQAGAAHFLEHMVPGGSPNRIRCSREFERLGGAAEFFTSPEYTLCLVDATPDKLTEASRALSSLLFDEHFEEKQFRVEQKIILHELAEIEDDPREKINEMLMQCLFKKHPIRRPTGGHRKTVHNLTLEKLTQIHTLRYAPQNMILILSGKISDEEAHSAVANFSCHTSKTALKKRLLDSEKTPLTKSKTKTKAGLSQSYLALGARTVPSSHSDVAALDVLNVALGVGASSRLFIELREKRALAYSIGSSQNDGLDFGYFNIECALKQRNAEKAKNLILKELASLRTQPIPDAELEKCKDMILGDTFRGVDSAEACPEILTIMEMRFGSETSLVDYVSRIKAVRARDLLNVANMYLTEEKFAAAILTPKK